MPTKFCDIVMKGGITSGVVYPPAAVELSKTFSFKNIGGTSAGAIAASLTAAAQYRLNRTGSRAGFDELAKLPEWLGDIAPGGNSNLFSLFQPSRRTRGIFRVLTTGIGRKRLKLLRVVIAAIYSFPLWALAGALPGIALLVLAYREGAPGPLFYWSLASGLLLALIGGALATVYGLYRRATKAIPENFYGICSGYAEPKEGAVEPLMTWLSKLINRTAGRAEDGPPLTFGELWGTRDPDAEREVNLEMMTTSLSHGRPYRLPFEENIFYFDPQEFGQFFPPEVVRWMVENPRDKDDPKKEHDKYAPLRPMPDAADLPLVVATRMSLSYPILLSAVPLHAIDYSRAAEEDHVPERCWFSDGGIASNFPVHFFDQSLPRWPTFGINLRPFHPDRPDTAVWMPKRNREGIIEWWTRFDGGARGGSLFSFLGSILNAMQNWSDNTQSRLPGYRDRIAHISLNDETEGGMNLNMPAPLIQELGQRGEHAAAELAQRYTADPGELELSWDNHRWVRYRSLMSLTENMLEQLHYAFHNPVPGDSGYEALITRGLGVPPTSYAWRDPEQQAYCIQATRELLDLAERWQAEKAKKGSHRHFGGKVPHPTPELRVRPRV